MIRKRALSRQARVLIVALLEAQGRWKHGYDLAALTGLKSGTLYPLLVRLETQGWLEAEWQMPAVKGRPPRHAYRLTAAGERLARAEALSTDGSGLRTGPQMGEATS